MTTKSKAQDPKIKPGNPPPNKPVTPARPDINPDPAVPMPGGNEPEKNDPARIGEPTRLDPARVDEPDPVKPDNRITVLE